MARMSATSVNSAMKLRRMTMMAVLAFLEALVHSGGRTDHDHISFCVSHRLYCALPGGDLNDVPSLPMATHSARCKS